MPALTASIPRLGPAADNARALHGAITFRLQWKWRIPATRHLAAAFPQIAGLSQQELGILAGYLHRTRRVLAARPAVMASSAPAPSPLPRAPAAWSPSAPAPPGTPATSYAMPPVVPPSSTSTLPPSTSSVPPAPPEHEHPTARQSVRR